MDVTQAKALIAWPPKPIAQREEKLGAALREALEEVERLRAQLAQADSTVELAEEAFRLSKAQVGRLEQEAARLRERVAEPTEALRAIAEGRWNHDHRSGIPTLTARQFARAVLVGSQEEGR